MTAKEKIVDFILKLTNEPKLDHTVNLFENGYLTSLDALDILAFIEETVKITIDEDDLSVENFGSIDAIVSYVERVQQ